MSEEPTTEEARPSPRAPTPTQITKDVDRLLAKCQQLAMKRVTALLEDLEKEKDPHTLINLMAKLIDIRLTLEWTERLADAIEKKPSNLTAPGTESPLLRRLASLAQRQRTAGKADGRTGLAKTAKRAAGFGSIPSE